MAAGGVGGERARSLRERDRSRSSRGRGAAAPRPSRSAAATSRRRRRPEPLPRVSARFQFAQPASGTGVSEACGFPSCRSSRSRPCRNRAVRGRRFRDRASPCRRARAGKQVGPDDEVRYAVARALQVANARALAEAVVTKALRTGPIEETELSFKVRVVEGILERAARGVDEEPRDFHGHEPAVGARGRGGSGAARDDCQLLGCAGRAARAAASCRARSPRRARGCRVPAAPVEPAAPTPPLLNSRRARYTRVPAVPPPAVPAAPAVPATPAVPAAPAVPVAPVIPWRRPLRPHRPPRAPDTCGAVHPGDARHAAAAACRPRHRARGAGVAPRRRWWQRLRLRRPRRRNGRTCWRSRTVPDCTCRSDSTTPSPARPRARRVPSTPGKGSPSPRRPTRSGAPVHRDTSPPS